MRLTQPIDGNTLDGLVVRILQPGFNPAGMSNLGFRTYARISPSKIADGNGIDDRVLEVVPIPAIQPGSPAVVLPDLGMVFVGGDGGTAGVQVGAPEIVFVRADGSGERLH